MFLNYRNWVFYLAALLILGGCERDGAVDAHAPINLTRAATSVEDGMILLDYPGPKSQVLKRNGGTDYYCDTAGMLNALLSPDSAHAIVMAYVQPFDGREWGSYADGWAEASKTVFVTGSKRIGAMGPTLVPFLQRGNAEAFARANGGTVLAFEEITAKVMADHARTAREYLIGGATGGMPGMDNHGGRPSAKKMESTMRMSGGNTSTELMPRKH